MENQAQGARIHKILSKDHKNVIVSLRKSDGTHTSNELESLQLLTANHFPDSENTDLLTSLDDQTFSNISIQALRKVKLNGLLILFIH